MLKKLYKLDLLWVNKFAPLFLGGALILSVASRLTSSLASVAGIILHNTLQSLAISALVGLVCAGLFVGVEFALDKTNLPHILTYAVMIAGLAALGVMEHLGFKKIKDRR